MPDRFETLVATMGLFSLETHLDVDRNRARFAALPLGSFEQHGPHLPVTTDTLIAGSVAAALCAAHGGLLVSPIGIGCSHEHAGFAGTLSISSTTLSQVVKETVDAITRQGVPLTVLVNGHGGNYVLSNVAQEMNVDGPRVLLALARHHWQFAAERAGIESTVSEDMHGGEIETSLLLHLMPDAVKTKLIADWSAPARPLLTLLGMRHYSPGGIIGNPSRATASKGRRLLDALVEVIGQDIRVALDAQAL